MRIFTVAPQYVREITWKNDCRAHIIVCVTDIT